LGRGLCRIRLGQKAAGLQDLEIAAAVEPQRALFRNYLGKAFGIMNDEERARLELDRGRSLDPKDPTSWLYSAILNQQQSRINRAVRELEVSRDLNQNRQVYRSQFLLDQDEAVRRANLASIYRDAGMFDVSVTEAALGVQADYANSSAHLFLADSFNTLRDSTRVNLRYDTVWINELLLANILAPVGAGRLSQNISQNEYSSLFSSTDPSLFSLTDYRSDGEVKELASFYGTYGNTGYAFDLDYQHNDGVRPNNDLSRVEWFTTIKHQITPSDSILVFTKYEDFEAGDIFQYYDPRRASPTFEYEEHQEPVALAAYHHQWRPGVHTLMLGGLLNSEQKASEPSGAPLSLVERPLGVVDNAARYPLEVEYKSQFDIYTSELQQIFQNDRQTFVAGVRYQAGDFDTRSLLTNPRPELAFLYTIPPADTRATEDFERMSFYGYYTLKLLDTLSLTGGIVHDRVTYPKNLRSPPIAPGHETDNQLSPKSALVWTPHPHLSVRGIYTRSLGGVSLDETYRLEPTQLAGFAQTFRTIIPESVVGSVETPSYQTAGVALDYWIKKTDTYLKLQVENLSSEVDRAVGNMRLDFVQNLFYPSITPQKLDYKETSLVLTANQLLSESWALGCQYKFTHAKLRHAYPELPLARDPWVRATERADLHRITLFGLFNHPSGLFARADAQFYQQHNTGYSPDKPGDAFWQYNLWVGYRLFHRRAELALGILNLTDQNYRLNPLSAYTELPRERVYSARLKWKL
jgi:hypothetical protein